MEMTSHEEARTAFLAYRRTGSPDELARVFDATAQELLLLASHLARPGVSAEDVLQSTFVRVMEVADAYDESRPLMPWLCGILSRVARHQARTARRRPESWRLDEEQSEDPEELARAREFREALAAAIARMSPREREILTLRLVHGLTPTQIAHALGHPVGSVKSWLHRGMARLRVLLPAGFTASLMALLGAQDALGATRERILLEAQRRAPPGDSAPRDTAKEPASGRPNPASDPAPTQTPGFPRWIAGSALLVVLVVALSVAWRLRGDPGAETKDAVAIERTSNDGSSTKAPGVSEPARDTRDVAARETNVHVRVRHSDGSPGANVVLRLEPRFGRDSALAAQWATCDARGEATFRGLEAGRHELLADRGTPQSIDVPARGANVELDLPQAIDVAGRVVDAEQRPIAGAPVWLSLLGRLDEGTIVAKTDADGRFHLRDVPVERGVCAHPAGREPTGIQFLEPGSSNAAQVLLISRGPGVAVSGRVLDVDGAPVAGAFVQLGDAHRLEISRKRILEHAISSPLFVRTDANGQFRFESVAATRSASVWARFRDGATIHTTIEAPRTGAAEVELRASSARTWSGSVESPDDDTPATELVELRVIESERALARDGFGAATSPRWAKPSAWIAVRGEFELRGLGFARALLRAEDARGRWDAREILPERNDVRWSPRLGSGHRLSGRVTSSKELAPRGWLVSASASDGTTREVAVLANGTFELDGLEDRAFDLCLRPPKAISVGGIAFTTNVRPGSGLVDLDVPADLVPNATVSATPFDRAGQPLTGAYLVRSGASLVLEGTPGDAGGVRFDAVAPGRYRLLVDGPQLPVLRTEPFEVASGAHVELGEVRPAAPGRLRIAFERGSAPLFPVLIDADTLELVSILDVHPRHANAWDLPPGRYLVSLNRRPWRTLQILIDVVSGATLDAEIDALPARACQLRVTDPYAGAGLDQRLELQHATSGARLHVPIGSRLAGTEREVSLGLEPGTWSGSIVGVRGDRRPCSFEVPQGDDVLELRVDL